MLGIPYMGSKRKIAKELMDYMLANTPNATAFYDLFGGGAAMSMEALKRPQLKKVVYNELDTRITELLKKIQKDGVTEEFYGWVDRETYKARLDEQSWFGGLLATCWSFGNNAEKGYLFSTENEKLKKPLHNFVVYKDLEAQKEFESITGVELPLWILDKQSIRLRRLALYEYLRGLGKRLDLTELKRLQLEQLGGLQQLERLQQLEGLEISNLSYESVNIQTPPEETIIYLDPPYAGTQKYKKDISFEALYEYIRNSPYKVYISSYDMPFFECKAIEHRSTLSATNNNKKVFEKLFCNREEWDKGILF